MKLFLAFLLTAFLVVIPTATAAGVEIQTNGGASGGDAIYCWQCDLLNFSNIQGGTPEHPNLDLGAGGDGAQGHPRGRLSLCFDVCSDTVVWDTTTRMLARFGPTGISLYGGGRLLVKLSPTGKIIFYGPVIFKVPPRGLK